MKKARAELPQREWIEFEVDTDPKGKVTTVNWSAWGCSQLLEAGRRAAEYLKTANIESLTWAGLGHCDLLVSEAFSRLQGTFKLPVEDAETCHCRKIPTARVDQAIVLGAHSPQKVTAWTSASSGCGTCRPDVEKLIAYRLKKAA